MYTLLVVWGVRVSLSLFSLSEAEKNRLARSLCVLKREAMIKLQKFFLHLFSAFLSVF